MLANQPAVTGAAAGVQEDPDRGGLVDSSDLNSAGSLDQQHVLERCVWSPWNPWDPKLIWRNDFYTLLKLKYVKLKVHTPSESGAQAGPNIQSLSIAF